MKYVFLASLVSPDTKKISSGLGIGYLAASLNSHGIGVILKNAITPDELANSISKINNHHELILVGLSLNIVSDIFLIKRAAKLLRSNGYLKTIVIGGHCATILYEKLLTEIPEIDYLLMGEAEESIIKLVDTLHNHDDYHQVPGLAYRTENGNINVSSRTCSVTDLDALPFPLRELEETRLLNPKITGIPIYSSRGCYGSCTFCSLKSFHRISSTKIWRARSPVNVVEEMEFLFRCYGVALFKIIDDNFIGPGKLGKRRAIGIAEEIIKRQLPINFIFGCRANDVSREEFALLKRAGLQKVALGLESGVQRALDFFNKRTSVSQNEEAIRILRSLQIDCSEIGFIMFDPFVTIEELHENMEFIRRTRIYRYPNPYLTTRRLGILPGTPIEEMLLTRKLIKTRKSLADYMGENLFSYPILDKRAAIVSTAMRLVESRYKEYLSVMEQFILDSQISPLEKKIFTDWHYMLGVVGLNIFSAAMEFIGDIKVINQKQAIKKLNSAIAKKLDIFEESHFGMVFKKYLHQYDYIN